MKLPPVPFWTWDRSTPRVTLTPGRVASGKLSFQVRVLRSLAGQPLYRRAQQRADKWRRDQAREIELARNIHWGLTQ